MTEHGSMTRNIVSSKAAPPRRIDRAARVALRRSGRKAAGKTVVLVEDLLTIGTRAGMNVGRVIEHAAALGLLETGGMPQRTLHA